MGTTELQLGKSLFFSFLTKSDSFNSNYVFFLYKSFCFSMCIMCILTLLLPGLKRLATSFCLLVLAVYSHLGALFSYLLCFVNA